MAEWNEKSLGEIAEVTKLAGFEFTKYIKYDDDGEIIALRALNLRNGELDLSDIKRISKKVSEGLTRSKIYKDDILLTYTGNGYGDCAIIEENDKYHLAPNICKIVPNQDVVFPYYLYCYIRSNAFYNHMLIKKLLKKHKYPPEGMEDAVQTVMTQCELWTDNMEM